jgi:lipid-binding SYLF domain-containing protein
MQTARLITIAATALTLTMATSPPAHARSAAQITAEGRRTLQLLQAREPSSRRFVRQARGVLVFPSIYKAGLVFTTFPAAAGAFRPGRRNSATWSFS